MQTNVQGWLGIRKRGRVFLGRQTLSASANLVNCGQLLQSELEWWDVGPQETHCGLMGPVHAVVRCSFVHFVQCLELMHLSCMCLYSWHVLQWMGSWMSLLTTTCTFEMKMHSVRSLLATSVEVQDSFTLVVLWLGDLSSGFLIQEAEEMEWGRRLRSDLIWCRWSRSEGSKLPSQGMN